MKRINLIFLMFVILILAAGLRIDKNVLEKLGMTIAAGYDQGENNTIKTNFVIHQIDPNSKSSIMTITSEAMTSKGARVAANRKSNKKIVSGQLRVAIYHDKLAQKGLLPLVDTLFRDASIASTVYMAVSKDSTEDLLMHKYTNYPDIGSFIVDNIHQNIIREQIVSGTLHEFLSALYSTADPIVPLLERKGESVELKDVAVFSGDRMVGVINPKEAFFLKTIRDRFKAGSVEMSIGTDQMGEAAKNLIDKPLRVVVDNISSDCDKTLVSQDPLKFQVHIKIKGMLTESSTQLNLGQASVIHALEKQMNKKSEEEIQALLKRLTSLNSDPIGFGEVYRSRVYHSNLTADSWHEMYKNASYDVKVDMRIVKLGQIQ